MAIRKYKPTTPGRRGSSVADFAEITRSTPEKSLLKPLPDVSPEDLRDPDGLRFGRMEREGKVLYRYRARDMRIYFEEKDEAIHVHRVLHKGTLADFLFRTKLGDADEDEILAGNKHFWKLIDEGARARKA